MKLFIVLSVFVASALSARLDNTYIPPPNAHSAGGHSLETPKQAYASNIQSSYVAPQQQQQTQRQYQQQNYNNGGSSQGTYTSQQNGNGFQSVSAGSYSGQNYQAPQASYSQPQSTYRQPQQSQQSQNSYQQQGYNSGYDQASTTPIPIIKCKRKIHE
jgi:hypothetical protein